MAFPWTIIPGGVLVLVRVTLMIFGRSGLKVDLFHGNLVQPLSGSVDPHLILSIVKKRPGKIRLEKIAVLPRKGEKYKSTQPMILAFGDLPIDLDEGQSYRRPVDFFFKGLTKLGIGFRDIIAVEAIDSLGRRWVVPRRQLRRLRKVPKLYG